MTLIQELAIAVRNPRWWVGVVPILICGVVEVLGDALGDLGNRIGRWVWREEE